MDAKKVLHIVAFTLLVLGGINWGVVGLWDYDLLQLVFPDMTVVQRVIETLIGVSAIYLLFTHKGDCKVCGGK
jgi:uncharacterized membrane protein YuzA (DUF378 family)